MDRKHPALFKHEPFQQSLSSKKTKERKKKTACLYLTMFSTCKSGHWLLYPSLKTLSMNKTLDLSKLLFAVLGKLNIAVFSSNGSSHSFDFLSIPHPLTSYFWSQSCSNNSQECVPRLNGSPEHGRAIGD